MPVKGHDVFTVFVSEEDTVGIVYTCSGQVAALFVWQWVYVVNLYTILYNSWTDRVRRRWTDNKFKYIVLQSGWTKKVFGLCLRSGFPKVVKIKDKKFINLSIVCYVFYVINFLLCLCFSFVYVFLIKLYSFVTVNSWSSLVYFLS